MEEPQSPVKQGIAEGEVPMDLTQSRPVPPADPLDGLLRAYYRKEMPRRWPPAPLPPSRPVPFPGSPRRSGMIRRHLALAASVALLVLGSFYVGGKVAPNRVSKDFVLPDNPEATRQKIRTVLSLEQDPMGGTAIKVDVTAGDVSPAK
jgi:hypothetical protein